MGGWPLTEEEEKTEEGRLPLSTTPSVAFEGEAEVLTLPPQVSCGAESLSGAGEGFD